ncbi:fasciclin domain-containing protein [Nocardioides sp.]|uniref:fasciclin domain-containing protein n=1 Tax=Nocardioides sp. TaxID=35761 RepID=UPI003D0B3A7F
MRIRVLTSAVVAGVALSLVSPAVATAQVAPAQKLGNKSLASVLAADGHRYDHNWDDFDILDKAVTTVLKAKPKSDVAVLADGKVALTAFLPTDRAFRRLVHDLSGKRLGSEKAVFKAVAGVADVKTLEAILLYHVVPGATLTYKVAKGADGAKLATALAGTNLRVKVRHGSVFLRDRDTDDLNARVRAAAKNINKGNKQIAHGINRVLRPINL